MSSHFTSKAADGRHDSLFTKLRRVNNLRNWPEESRKKFLWHARFRASICVALLLGLAYQYPETSFVMSWWHGVGMFDPAVRRGDSEFKWWQLPSELKDATTLKLEQEARAALKSKGDTVGSTSAALPDRRPREV